jgi:DNA protecting protein DprA
MIAKNLSIVAAAIPKVCMEQWLMLKDYFTKKGWQDLPPEKLLYKIPGMKEAAKFEPTVIRLRTHLETCSDLHLYPGHEDYPKCFYELSSPPLFLMLRGKIETLQSPCLSVVGSRKFSVDAASWMRSELKAFLQKSGVVVVSGGAYGVDQEAHKLALYHGGGTLVVLPSGLDEIYPPQLRQWQGEFLELGALFLSEWLPWEKVRPYHFQHRNRLIASLSPGTLVVEAGEKSGTMITANWAAELGREVGVIPGSPLDPSYRGSLKLLQAGADLIADRSDLQVWWDRLKRTSRTLKVPALFEQHGCQSSEHDVGTPHS